LSDYRGGTQRLVSAIEVDIPNARARLDKMVDSLEAYLALAPPEMPRTAEEQAEADLVRPGETPAPAEPPAPAPPGAGENVEPPPGTPPTPPGNVVP
jgi:hypothetical protein